MQESTNEINFKVKTDQNSDDEHLDVPCNETCKIDQCREGCNFWTNAISSSCHEVCDEERKLTNKLSFYCTIGCNIAINLYMKAIEDEVGTPAQPYLVAETRTNTSITIEWGRSVYENISYLVQFRYDSHYSDWDYYKPGDIIKEKNSLKIENLHPYTKYRFRVAYILLENYPPLFSWESVAISTLAYGVPSTAPIITCLTAVSCTRVSLSWDPPMFPNGPILSYVLFIEEFSPSGKVTMIKDISDNSNERGLHYMIQNLKPATTYKISLSTRNSFGDGPFDVKNITTLTKRISSSHHTPAYLLFASEHTVLKQGLRMFDQSLVLYKTQSDKVFVTGIAVHVQEDILFLSHSDGEVFSLNMKKGGVVAPPTAMNKLIYTNETETYFSLLSFDWLNNKIYMIKTLAVSGQHQLVRCESNGKSYEVLVKNISRPSDLHVDPLNGYLYMTIMDSLPMHNGGLYRIDLAEFDYGLTDFKKAQLIFSDNHLAAFAVDHKNFRLLLPFYANNSIISLSLDGNDVSDIRENSQTQLYKNIRSLAVHFNLLYWATGNFLYREEFHKKELKYYQNAYSLGKGPFSFLNVYHVDYQPSPLPLNPVESLQALFGFNDTKISWSSPRLLSGQGKGSYKNYLFEVQLLDHSKSLKMVKVNNIDKNLCYINNLLPNTTYSVKVRAYTAGGTGPWSSEFLGNTLKTREERSENKELPYILWGARDGLLKSDFLGSNVAPIVLKINLNNALITDICSFGNNVFINTNSSFVYVYNTFENSLSRLPNITMANSIAIDWLAPKLYFSSAANQMIARSGLSLDSGSMPEALPIITMAKEIAVDSWNAFLYWITPNSVERSRLNGMEHFVYMKHALFSGKHVMGLALNFEVKKIYFLVRSFEGSLLFEACMANDEGISFCKNSEEPEMVASLSEDGLHGPVYYFNNKIFWLHENQKAFVSDLNGKNFAQIKGLGLNGITSLQIIDPMLQSEHTGNIKVVPSPIPEDAVRIKGTHDLFNITWDPVIVTYGKIFYEIIVDDDDEVFSCITNETVFVYPSMKRLSPYTKLSVEIKAFTFYASSKKTIVKLHSPSSIPSNPLQPRIYVTYKASLLNREADIEANFRWSPPSKTNGVILKYRVICWKTVNSTRIPVFDDVIDGKSLQLKRQHLLPNTTYGFKVHAFTAAGMGPPSIIAESVTSIERPVPKLLVANSDSLKMADIDFHEEKLLLGKKTNPASIAYLAEEKKIFYLEEEGSLIVSSIDGTNASLVKHLTYSKGTTLSIDWIGRKLYFTEVQKKDDNICSTVYAVDLSLSYDAKSHTIFNISAIINSLEVEPFSGSLIWTSTIKNNSNLMVSDLDGSNIRPFFNLHSFKDNKGREKPNINCNCTFTSVGEAIAIDNTNISTNISNLKVLFTDGVNILSSDIYGCVCHMLVNATESVNSGLPLPPSSITVDSSNIYWFSKNNIGTIYSKSKVTEVSHPLIAEGKFTHIRSIRAIGPHLQPFPDASCLILKSYINQAQLLSYTFHSLTLYLPHVIRPAFCSRISSPSLLYTVFYWPTKEIDFSNNSCSLESKRKFCKREVKKSYNSTIILENLQAFTMYSIRVAVENYYSGLSTPGPEVVYQTAVGIPSKPINVSAKSVTPQRIDISWEPPLVPNGSPIFYEIHLKVKNSSKGFLSAIFFECGKESSSDLSASISTTESGKNHYITVRAYSADCEMYSDSEEIILFALEPPNNITMIEAMSRSLELSWTSPDHDSILNHFLEFSQKDEQEKWKLASNITDTEPSTVNLFLIDNLVPKTKYNFRLVLTYILTHTEEREKFVEFIWPDTFNFEFSTTGDVPSPPGKPEVKQVVKDVFQLFWPDSINYGFHDLIYEIDIRSDDSIWTHCTNSSVTTWIVNNLSDNIHYEFRIRAINEFGSSEYTYSEKKFLVPQAGALIEKAEEPFGIVIALCVSSVILLSVFVASFYMIHLKKEKCKSILQATEIPDLELATLQELPLHANFVHQTNALYNLHDLPSDEELLGLPQYKREQIMVTKYLGSGAFGEVFEGLAFLTETSMSIKVAIKTLKKGSTEHEKEEFLKEAKLMSNFKHDHILQLVGVCFDSNPNFLLLELMEGGDLLSFLRSNRPTVFENSNLMLDDLIKICIDVAKGCKYLEDMHFVHRDLAARNCLVSSYEREYRIVKIGDFGLARDVYKSDYYRKEGEGLLPVRWMAPESLVYGVFTTQSDVWAFGILLWEVITLGMQPYPARTNMEVLNYVRAGGRLDKPENCPDELHEIMTDCWIFDAENRPTFCSCLHVLEELRNKLASSSIAIPSVYNFDYFSQGNVGTYIGRYDPQDDDKLLERDQNFDSRSTQSDPPTLSEIMLETDLLSMRRSLSWTNVMLRSSENHTSSATRVSTKPNPKFATNKYLELLGDNEDSDGYQLPLQLLKTQKQALSTSEKRHDLANVTSISSNQIKPLSSNCLTLNPESLSSDNDFLSERVHKRSPVIHELNLVLESHSVSTANSENSWLEGEDCDNWSFSTASTATCPMDVSLNSIDSCEVSALSSMAGISINHSSKSSFC
ncbi:proto-oncogene tyrosine-protein kinase ROS [Trichonephila clavata]|uniref:Tyrosine-protein kinase receptor n=1 Tax=Trichonephila clavata TaxID=2740835 RepID=A0A8X6FWR6_TRICU|nr:proto-oncogene tyrosine-protein kinase ROS [Trichonephila clavata]